MRSRTSCAREAHVHTPDLFDGRTFGSIDEGLAHVREHGGFGEVIAAASRRRRLTNELVYSGFSLGVVPAQKLAQTRPGARGAPLLLLRACVRVRRRGRQASRCRSTGWTPTRSSSTRATSMPPASSSSVRRRRAVPLPRRPALLRRQQPAELRRRCLEAADGASAHVPRARRLNEQRGRSGRRSRPPFNSGCYRGTAELSLSASKVLSKARRMPRFSRTRSDTPPIPPRGSYSTTRR